MVQGYTLKEGKAKPKIVLHDSERILLEKAACDAAGVNYPETYYNAKEREFLYFKNLFPKSYYRWIDQIWRALDERDGKEYIIYHAYQYVDQEVTTPEGKKVIKPHSIDGYYGFHHEPIVHVKEFNADGSPADLQVIGSKKVYDIPWSKEAFDALVDDPQNRGATHQFAIGIAPQDGSLDVPIPETTQLIRNREDFANHDYDTVMQLGRSQLSRVGPSMADIQRTLALRNQLNGTGVGDTSAENTQKGKDPKVTK